MKILIVGLGSIGKKHIDAIYELYPRAIIVALRSCISDESYRGVVNLYNLSELSFVPDFIIISNISILHEETIMQMISLKSPLFIEKPVLCNLTNATLISKLVKSNEIITYVACNMRFHPCIEYLKSYLQSSSSKINEVNIYCGSYLPNWRANKNFKKIYSANKEMGGGVDLDLIHELDYTVWLFGFPYATTRVSTSKSSLEINSIDCARYILEYEEYTVGITLNYYRIDSRRSIEVLFDNDTIHIDLLTSTIKSMNSGEILFNSKEKMSDIYLKQINYFIKQFKMNEYTMNDFDTAVDVLKIAL